MSAVLDTVGILEFVDENMSKPVAVGLEDVRKVFQQVVGQKDEIVEVDEVIGAELGFVGSKQPPLSRRVWGIGVFPDDALHPLEMPERIRHAALLPAQFREGPMEDDALQLLVGHGEARGETGPAMMRPQDADAELVKGPHPRSLRTRQGSLEARRHLFGGLVREGEGENPIRGDAADVGEVADAFRQDQRLPGAGARKDEHRTDRGGHGRELFRIQGHGVRIRVLEMHGSVVNIAIWQVLDTA